MDDNRQQMIAQIKALKELQRRRAKRTFHDFLQYVNPKGADLEIGLHPRINNKKTYLW